MNDAEGGMVQRWQYGKSGAFRLDCGKVVVWGFRQ